MKENTMKALTCAVVLSCVTAWLDHGQTWTSIGAGLVVVASALCARCASRGAAW